MFNVNLNGVDYKVTFWYKGTATVCTLYCGTSALDDAVAICSIKDQFNKNKGRKVALGKLLQGHYSDRNDRKLFWQAYFKARNGKY